MTFKSILSSPKLAARYTAAALAITVSVGSSITAFAATPASSASSSLPQLAQKASPKKPASNNTKPSANGKPAQQAAEKEALPPDSAFVHIDADELLKNPTAQLNKYVELVGVFNRFSDTGLDYKKAFRDSRDYVSLFILRPDVEPRQIPLSELKLFFPRKKSDEVVNLEGGDTIRIRGKVFSTALNEPWVDVLDVKILQKTKDSTAKKAAEDL
ncbi:MAG: hypothetical protein VKJ04_01315 [Vampirovibrionales bacterium]|nr:hypothetical protein [Vampirovibrionales bacterium]